MIHNNNNNDMCLMSAWSSRETYISEHYYSKTNDKVCSKLLLSQEQKNIRSCCP